MKHWVTFVGYLEGFSFLILMFYAMPLKYISGEPEMVSLFGSIPAVCSWLTSACFSSVSANTGP